MSRSGYSEDCYYDWDWIRWRGIVASATRGKRGQRLLTELRDALEAMPEKRLIREALETPDGAVCALGAVGKMRKIDMTTIDPENRNAVASSFDIADSLAAEIMYLNDDYYGDNETPENRHARMLAWVKEQIRP